jgi:DNA topoisomerase-1
MADAEGESMSVKLGATTKAGEPVEFSASGRTISFHGYLKAYVESSDDRESGADDQETALPRLKEGEVVPVAALEALGHTTSPPARFTEASLVKKLEELGIGRPSTYASIMETLQRKYVWKKGQALIPNWDAFAVVALMEKHFVDLIDLAFTAELEEDLDEIAGGAREKVSFLKEFYFGDRKHQGLKRQVTQNLEDIDAALVNSIRIGDDPQGREIVVKPGRYGPYIRRGEDTVGLPDALPPDEVTVERALQLLSAPRGDTPIGQDPATGKDVFVKQGRFGPYVQLGPASDDEKPRTASLFKSMKPEAVTLAQALELLTLPRVVGTADDGEEIIAQNGRYGPYLTKGKDSRNLGADAESRLLTITVAEALELFKQPKQFRGRGQARPPLATFGADPVSGKDVVLKEGRFGFYVTDGETNATLRKGDQPAELTQDRAHELLAQRREYDASDEGQARARRRGTRKAGKAPRTGKAAPKAKPRKPAAAPVAVKRVSKAKKEKREKKRRTSA